MTFFRVGLASGRISRAIGPHCSSLLRNVSGSEETKAPRTQPKRFAMQRRWWMDLPKASLDPSPQPYFHGRLDHQRLRRKLRIDRRARAEHGLLGSEVVLKR